MIEVEVVKIDIETLKCVDKRIMKVDDWRKLKKQSGFLYYAYDIGFHSFKVEKTND